WDATVALGQKELERQDDLLKKEFSSQQARDQANERLLVAQAQLEASRKALDLVRTQYREELKQAQAELERARAAVTGAETQLSYAVLQAPISGVIGSVSTQEGETVAAGLSAPTFVTIIDLGRLQVDAYVDEVDIGKVQVGQRTVFSIDAFPALEFEAKAIAIYPKAIVQDNVVKYVVATEIVTPYEGRLRPEMTATVSIHLETRTVLALPSRAVKRERGRNVVHVRGGVREIKVGWKDGPWVEVAAGLEEGEEVLLEAPATEKGGSP
ncbi:MAG TPA: efflux RND transporter periplasmic adaptor subunit, partial [Planctomycetota bacterium]|nr:efflux RND transporter periplasmic adaptor subunit [Planctomycetota bacterium]